MMRITITTLLLVLVYVHPLSADAKVPDWYGNLPSREHEEIGYGSGPDEEAARGNAIKDVARSMGVSIVESEDESNTKNEDGDRTVTRTGETVIKVRARLFGLEPIKQEKRGRTWYVAVSYDYSPPVDTLDKVVREFTKGSCERQFHDVWTEFSRQIKEKLQCVPYWYLDYDQQNRNWILDVAVPGNRHHKFPLRMDELEDYIPDRGNVNLEIRPSKGSVMESKEGYYLVIDNNQAGWLYLFNVTQEGQSILMKSFGRKVPEKGRRYPTRDPRCGGECDLISELPGEWDNDTALEHYMVALCPRKADFHGYPIGLEVPDVDDPNTYSYGRILREARRGNCDVAGSRLIVHREKK